MNSSFSHHPPRNLDRGSACIGSLSAQSLWREWAIALIDFLTGKPNIAIRPKYVRGALQWTVYDPRMDELHSFNSERAVRAWLEERHASKI